MIEVKKISGNEFNVKFNEKNSETNYRVTLNDNYYRKLVQGKISKEELIKKSFKFLLKRETKESIFSSFNLEVIKKYFSEYEEEIRK